jgi:hypothetical protein
MPIAALGFTAADTIGAASLAASAVAAASAYQQGQQQSAADRYNAAVEQQRAATATQEAAAQAQQQETQNQRNYGATWAALGAAGVAGDEGSSPLAVMLDEHQQGALADALITYKGKTQALASTEQSQLDATQGQQAANAGVIKAGGTLLQGGVTAAGPQGFNLAGTAGKSPAAN